ncbi:Thiol:disulfide interchange protein TlpA [BD1-7 clade bacterium]|uniref:Thiol:disulfide interchange protein TlpA n=1 Tax=BD1-7 clade bacterium TaxID=2029982 RepID=A0A5S9NMM4_9GAMM|nr:Thiol:disulfide interchange protein TlpA [BD1-7 clade bacterium]CAA0093971.1 Thiol:disulfide interchange protein TlpA [BD1-7 clade bacterium]
MPLQRFIQCLLGPIALALCLSACSSEPDFYYATGKPGHYNDYSGQWLVVNYWAAWCKPCIEEIPELNELNHSNDDVNVIGINYDKKPAEQIAKDASKLDVAFPVALANFHEHYNYAFPKVLPTTVVIDPEGKVTATLLGPQTQEDVLNVVRGHLAAEDL